MSEVVKEEAKLHIAGGIEKASGASGVDVKVGVLTQSITHLLLIGLKPTISNISLTPFFRL